MNKLPFETLCQISDYLSFEDQYSCLFVCQFWFYSFQRILYKNVHVYSNTQFDLLVQCLSKSWQGEFIKALHLHNDNKNQSCIKVSQEQLKIINDMCPQLEIFDFDPSQWQHLTLTAIKPWKKIVRCAPLRSLKLDFLSVFGTALTFLKLNSTFSHSLVPLLSQLSTLRHLSVHLIFEQPEDVGQLLESIHLGLPLLDTLEFMCPTPSYLFLSDFRQQSRLKSLVIQAHSSEWYPFIQTNYPSLESLSLYNVLCTNSPLLNLIRHLPLRSLFLQGLHDILTEPLKLELDNHSLQHLEVQMESFQSLSTLSTPYQLHSLRLYLWDYTPLVGSCHHLVSLELVFPRAIRPRYPYEPFLIDVFLSKMPRIQHLSLTGAEIQVLYQNLVDLEPRKTSLQHLALTHCRLQNPKTTQAYLDLLKIKMIF
ncbi:hypothetical protein G6F56_007089 [Rhizopus delemar]|nr:hypothetical protein G6F56_007089 [Rhizopus delemar]